MSALFQPYTLKNVTLRNRIAVPPMCQYMAVDGAANDWHLSHYAGMARGGAGLVIVEATAVAPEGRITPGCTGIWNDDLAQAFVPVVKAIKAAGSVPGIQIAHAGRKASSNRPWEGDDHIPEGDARGWQTIAPSAIAFGGGLPKVPRAMDLDDIARVKQNFVDAAVRAREVGFEWLELHFAHGYLAQSFFSAHSNQRDDIYGGSLENRSRFLLETLKAVREVWPEHLPLTIRFGVLEFDGRDEQTLLESIGLVRQFKVGHGHDQRQHGLHDSRRVDSMGPRLHGADCRARAPRSGCARLFRLGLRHASDCRARRQGRATRRGDGRQGAPGQSALGILCRQGTRRGTRLVDPSGAVCALARALLIVPDRCRMPLQGQFRQEQQEDQPQ